MKVPTLHFLPGGTLTGDMATETWWTMVRYRGPIESRCFDHYLNRVHREILPFGLTTARVYREVMSEPLSIRSIWLLLMRSEDKDPVWRLLIGDAHRSRKVAVHQHDARGIFYILEDDNQGWLANEFPVLLKPLKPVKAITFHALTVDGLASLEQHLELDNYQNERLVPWEMRTSGT